MSTRSVSSSTANADGGRAWASGRVLTPQQRARKQETDRRGSRTMKKAVQDRLSQLEARVLQLEKLLLETSRSSGSPVLSPTIQESEVSVPPAADSEHVPQPMSFSDLDSWEVPPFEDNEESVWGGTMFLPSRELRPAYCNRCSGSVATTHELVADHIRRLARTSWLDAWCG